MYGGHGADEAMTPAEFRAYVCNPQVWTEETWAALAAEGLAEKKTVIRMKYNVMARREEKDGTEERWTLTPDKGLDKYIAGAK
jgi:hypothetical protein